MRDASHYTVKITIPGLPPISSNGAHGSWRAKWVKANNWKNFVIAAIGKNKPPKPLTKAHVTLTRHSGLRPDFDNLAISFKPLMDGLKMAGVIIDDKHSVIGVPEYLWEIAPKGKGFISITVSEQGDHQFTDEVTCSMDGALREL